MSNGEKKAVNHVVSGCLAVVRCPAFVLRVVSSTATSVGTVVNVSCLAGQKLQTGHSMTRTLCSRSGDWIPSVPECVGEQQSGLTLSHRKRVTSLTCSTGPGAQIPADGIFRTKDKV